MKITRVETRVHVHDRHVRLRGTVHTQRVARDHGCVHAVTVDLREILRPEVLVARHGGMKVVGISTITNMALADSDEPVNHEEVLAVAEETRPRFMRLMKTLIGKLGKLNTREL